MLQFCPCRDAAASVHLSPVAVRTSREHVAARIRVLLATSRLAIAELAAQLGVIASELGASVDELAPYPTVDVLAGVVDYYGVDPHYLLTGEYNPETHGIALEGGREATRAVLGRLITQLATHAPAAWTPAPPRFSADDHHEPGIH